MNLIVPDASVAVKWCLPVAETLVDAAVDLLNRHHERHITFLVPDLFWTEFGNVMCKAIRQGRCTRQLALDAIRTMRSWALPTVPSTNLLELAFEISQQYQRSFYDSVYLALAISQHATLITADERLVNAVGEYLPVRWLGA